MRNLPVPVKEEDIEEMFEYADKDKDGKITYSEFQIMINPQKKPSSPEKKSMKSLKKFLPQLKNMAKKEGLTEEKKEEKSGEKQHIKADTVLAVFKDEKVKIKI